MEDKGMSLICKPLSFSNWFIQASYDVLKTYSAFINHFSVHLSVAIRRFIL